MQVSPPTNRLSVDLHSRTSRFTDFGFDRQHPVVNSRLCPQYGPLCTTPDQRLLRRPTERLQGGQVGSGFEQAGFTRPVEARDHGGPFRVKLDDSAHQIAEVGDGQ